MPREHSATTRREEANPSTLIRPLPLTPSSSDGKKTSSSSSSSSSSSLSLRRIGQTILNSPFYAGASPTNKPAADQDRQSSLLAMIEERRKSGLKLRGLVIPDLNTSNTSSTNNNNNKPLSAFTSVELRFMCRPSVDPSSKMKHIEMSQATTEYPSKKWTFSPDSRTSDNIFLATKSFWDSKTELSGAASPPTTTTLQHHHQQQQHQLRTSVVVGPTPTLPHHQKEIKKFASEKNLLKVERDTMASVTNASAAASTTAINAADVNKTDGDKWNELQRKYSSSSDVTVIGESFGKQRPKDLLMSRLKSASLSPQKDSDHHRCFSSSISSNSSINITTGATEAGTTTSTTTTNKNNNNNRAPVKALAQNMAPSEASELCEQQDVLDGEVEAEAESLGSRSSSSQELLLMGAGGSSLLGQPLLSAALDNNRGSSVDSSTSEEGSIQAYTPGFSSYVGLTGSGMRDFGGSVTSLASTTSLISPQELQQLMEDADAGDGSGTPSHEILVVVLHREYPTAGSVGITLAGGADYDTKDITIHRVISGSVADRDGRVQRGDRILSINGRGLKGLTHSEAMNILKMKRFFCSVLMDP
ncbi:unnamed protein product [Notodromas monacha]|uniref:PDZ domain-containing protein n=1 Tax=Notodromas monacha TaxID=399045 RepID=A0A7R9GCW7_9CRUS|nr:unnamed protein product [Notodromas monacha]CAG0916530.1 unnamed protein product [Notodromas monacha]